MNIFYLLLIFSLTFLIKEVSGPWGTLSWFRNKLFTTKYIGLFFYQLFNCWYCLSFHCSYLIYFLTQPRPWSLFIIIEWGLIGAIFSLIMGSLLEKLQENK